MSTKADFVMPVEDRFSIGRYLAIVGTIESGSIEIGDEIEIEGSSAKIRSIEQYRKHLERAEAGEHVGLLCISGLSWKQVPVGAILRRKAH